MESIISKGKDIRQAIDIGLSLLETTKDQVKIEIIQNETKGFWGIGSKEGIVKLTKVERDSRETIEDLISKIPENPELVLNEREERLETKTDALEGKVWVKGGHLYCKSSPTQFPMVTIHPGVSLYKNGLKVNDSTTVILEKDAYEIKADEEMKETKWSMTLDNHRLRVLLEVEPGYTLKKIVPDVEADSHIDLKVQEVREVQNTLSYAEILQKLESLNVKHGFNQAEISKAIEASEPGTFEIAMGISPKPGKDGWIDVKVDIDLIEEFKEKEDGSIDFREIKKIPSVERGQVIAEIHPPIPGEMGYTVTNEPLPAKQTHPVVLRTGKGVMLVDDKIVATESGRPFIEKRGHLVKVAILQKLTHVGDVDLTSGNIRFMGDVEIFGEVKEAMEVEAAGDLVVHQTIEMATLTASGAVIALGKNIIGSEISAGKNNMLIAELGHQLGILQQHTFNLTEVIKQLIHSTAFKSGDLTRVGIQPLIKILLEKKFKSFPATAKQYVDIVRRGEKYLQDDEWREIAVLIEKYFLSLNTGVVTLDAIKLLSKKMKELYEVSKAPVEPDSYITISNALNSRLYCSGNILIAGQGCINTKVHAGGALKITGVLRGGEVYGRLGVDINEVGAESGTPTLIAVPDDQKIYIKKVMEGCTIKIGNSKYTFPEVRKNITAFLNDDGIIAFE